MVRRRLRSWDDPVRAAQAGDAAALEHVLDAAYPRMFAVCLRMLHDRTEAADCTQEAMIKVVRGLDGFDHRAAFSTWCHRVAATTALDAIRHRSRRPRAAIVRDDAPEPDWEDARAAGEVTDGVERAEVRDRLSAALAALPTDFAHAVVLRDVAELDYAEIADELGVTVGTVKSRIARGRRMLAAALNADSEQAGNPAARDDVQSGPVDMAPGGEQ